MRVLGVDPGLTRCGVGVVDGSPGRPLDLVHVEVLRTPADDRLERRLLALADALEEAVARHRPDVVVVERVFAQHNVRTVTGTAQVAGLALLAAARHGLPVHLHTPSEVKAAITGSGTADKAQVTAMVVRILKLAEAPRPADAADALALAICHVWRGAGLARLAAAQKNAAQKNAAQKNAAQPDAVDRARHQLRSRTGRPTVGVRRAPSRRGAGT